MCIPDKIISRIPTAGLRKGQTDRDDLGCSYFQAEVIIAAKDQGMIESVVEIAHHCASSEGVKEYGNLAEVDDDMVKRVLMRHEMAKHKLCVPVVIDLNLYN